MSFIFTFTCKNCFYSMLSMLFSWKIYLLYRKYIFRFLISIKSFSSLLRFSFPFPFCFVFFFCSLIINFYVKPNSNLMMRNFRLSNWQQLCANTSSKQTSVIIIIIIIVISVISIIINTITT